MSLRDLRPLLFAAVIGVVVAFVQTVGGVGWDVLTLVPPLLLVLPLLAGRYVGEKQLLRLIERRRQPRVVAPAKLAMPQPVRRVVGRGVVLAARLGGRAPPRLVLAAV